MFNNFFKVRKVPVKEQVEIINENSQTEEFDFSNVLTAKQAHEIADDCQTYSYLDSGVLQIIFDSIEEAARKHQYSIASEIGGAYLSPQEIAYCKNILEKAGYEEVNIFNSTSQYVYPQSLKFGMFW
jgi:hypothetical protein